MLLVRPKLVSVCGDTTLNIGLPAWPRKEKMTKEQAKLDKDVAFKEFDENFKKDMEPRTKEKDEKTK